MNIGLALLTEPRGLEARGLLPLTERRLEPREELPQEDIEGRGDEEDLSPTGAVIDPDIMVASAIDLGQVAPLEPRGRGSKAPERPCQHRVPRPKGEHMIVQIGAQLLRLEAIEYVVKGSEAIAQAEEIDVLPIAGADDLPNVPKDDEPPVLGVQLDLIALLG